MSVALIAAFTGLAIKILAMANAESAARRGYVDQIVEPADTRKYIIGAFEMLATKCVSGPDKKHGTV